MMIYKKQNQIPLYCFENLNACTRVKHFVTTRKGGVSQGNYASLNLGYGTGDEKENVEQNLQLLADQLNVEPEQLIFPVQTHSSHIQIIRSKEDISGDFMDTDGLITDLPGLFIAVRTADCVPLLLYEPQMHIAGVVHAGWKGTLKNIAGRAVQLMKQEWGIDPAGLYACIGPSISPDYYEVGEEVMAEAEKIFGSESHQILHHTTDNKAFFDLWRANALLLLKEGIEEARIETSRLCTYQQEKDFFSARRTAGKTGRMASGIMLV